MVRSFRTSVATTLRPAEMEILERLCHDRDCTPSEVLRELILAAGPKAVSDQTIRVVRN
jgi:hypothetical protein